MKFTKPKFKMTALISAMFATSLQTQADSLALEEILVTAERRSESIQDISASIAALSADQIEKLDISSAVDLQNHVPNLAIRSNTVGTTSYSIRGVGKAVDDVSTDSGVGVFIDDIFLPRNSAASGAMVDIERIEVLRGPQGTLYGRNTAGGSVNFITKQPGEELEGKVVIDVGSNSKRDAKAYISGPIVSDTLYGKVSLFSLKDDGYMINDLDGSRGKDSDSLGGRIGLRFLPSDRAEFIFSADFEKSHTGPNLASLGPNDGYLSNVHVLFNQIALSMGAPAGPFPGFPADDDYHANVNVTAGESFETSGFMSRLNLTFENFDTAFILGAREAETFWNEDSDRTPVDLFNESHDEDAEWGSFEIRLVSNPEGSLSMGGDLQWTAGLYYFYEDTAKAQSLFGTDLISIATGGAFPPGILVSLNGFQEIETGAYAVFGEVTYDLTDRLSLILGGRWTDEEKTFSAATSIDDPTGIFGPGTNGGQIDEIYDTEVTESWDDFLGKVAIEYSVNEDILVYGLISQGFKSGGFTGFSPTEAEARTPFEPESVLNYELGIKATTWDGRLRSNLAVFFAEYTDLQEGIVVGIGSPQTVNKDAEIFGVELESEVVLTEGLNLSFNLGWLDTEVVKNDDNPAEVGEEITNIPELTYNINLEYRFPVLQGEMELRADYIWEDEVFGSQGFGDSPEWDTLGLRATYTPESERWQLALWGRNVTDEVYWTSNGIGQTAGIGATPRKLQPDRTLGATLTYFLGR